MHCLIIWAVIFIPRVFANQTEYDQLVAKSLYTLNRLRYSSVGLTLAGLAAVVANILILATVIRCPRLHKRCFFLIANLAAADWLVGASYVVTGIKRVVRWKYSIPEVATQWHCCAEMYLSYLGQSASLTVALMIAVERLIGTIYNDTYDMFGTWSVIALAFAGWFYAVVDSTLMFYGVSRTKLIPNCTIVSSVTDIFYQIQAKHKLGLVFMLTFLYSAVLYVMHKEVEKAKLTSENIASIKKRLQVRVGRMLAVVGFMYLIFQIVTRGIMAALGSLEASNRASYGPYVRTMMILNSAVNFPIYFGMSTEFKSAFLELIGKNNAVAPTPHATRKMTVKSQHQKTLQPTLVDIQDL